MSGISNSGPLAENDSVLFIDRKDREYLRALTPGKKIHLHGGVIAADELIGGPDGRTVRNSAGDVFIVVRPTYAQLIPNLPRKAQVIYPKDIGPILMLADIYPGATVIEVGVGPGSLTMALLRAVGSTGRVISYELREDHVEMARGNITRFLGSVENWSVKTADAAAGFDEHDVDRMTIDVPEPWRVIPVAAQALRPGAVLLSYSPTVLQVKQVVDTLTAHGSFGLIQVSESLQRFWHVRDLSVRPEHRMVAHTGFLVSARRLAEPAAPEAPLPSPSASCT